MNRSGDSSGSRDSGSVFPGSTSFGPSIQLERAERLLRPWRPTHPRVLVAAREDDWFVNFRALALRQTFIPRPVLMDWIRDPVETDIEPRIQRSTAVCIWHWGTLSAEQILHCMDRSHAVTSECIHFVATSRWSTIDRLHWTRLGASATLQNPEDLWSYRRLIQGAIQRSKREGTGSKGTARGGRLP